MESNVSMPHILVSGLRIAVVFSVLLGQVQQSPTSGQQEFEVASIKPSASDDIRTLIQLLPGGGLRISAATLKFLVTEAYQVRSFEISGGAGWIATDRFDIVAKSDRTAAPDEIPIDPRQITQKQYQTMRELMRPRLQALLADRFQLKLHRETREESVYALVVDKNGTKVQSSTSFRGLHIGRGELTGDGATMEMLVSALAGQLRRPVLDRTGLKGAFDFKLEWAPDTDSTSTVDSSGPSIFTALREQVGLRLESTKGPVEVLVIDHVERPSGN